MAREVWHIGNTTVRTPYRLRDGLRVLANSCLVGNLSGRQQEAEFARLLHESGVVFVERIAGGEEEDYSDVGRKWRVALMQLGFITPKFPGTTLDSSGIDSRLQAMVTGYPKLTGRPYEITPSGECLINAETLSQQQECFLRALLAYRLPSPLEADFACDPFSPVRAVLEIMSALEATGLEAKITTEEMALIVQLAKGGDETLQAARTIAEYRHDREAVGPDKRTFDRDFAGTQTGRDGAQLRTLYDYADLNFRYLKATGLFSSKGRSIVPSRDKERLIEQIHKSAFAELDEASYLHQLWSGASLPTDSPSEAIEVIESLSGLLQKEGKTVTLPALKEETSAGLAQIRLGLEDEWQRLQEESFAGRQRTEWHEILDYMSALAGASNTASIPRAEAPAYLEWTIWRAFLAIDSFRTPPWMARRFKIDQDFLPIGTAPGNGPDMLFEFDDFVLVVEVTLTSSSRQEAAEGEPVRRHVARVVEDYDGSDKPVYGLFIANTIDSNTAETFRIGVWYRSDDSRLALRIVPLTLSDFAAFFEACFHTGKVEPYLFEQLLRDCRVASNEDAPSWKTKISAEVTRHVTRIGRTLG